MGTVNNDCQYVLDPDDPETSRYEKETVCHIHEDVLNEDGVWSCAHNAEVGSDLCIFHQPTDEKEDKQVVERFLEKMGSTSNKISTTKDEHRFIGARLGKFSLPEESQLGISDIVLDFRYAVFEDDASFEGANFTGDVQFSGTIFTTSVHFEDVVFDGNTSFVNTVFNESAYFDDAVFCGQARFGEDYAIYSGSQFNEMALFEGAEFEGRVNFRGMRVKRWAKYNQCKFKDEVDFTGVVFNDLSDFSDAEFHREVMFHRTEFDNLATFRETNFLGGVKFRQATFSDVNFLDVMFGKETSFLQVEFEESSTFRGSRFGGEPAFTGVEFRGKPSFVDVHFQNGANFSGVNLTDANFKSSFLQNTDFENAQLNRATLFGADLRGARLFGAKIGDVLIDESTRFLGHMSDDGGNSPHSFRAIISKQCCVYDPKYEPDGVHEDSDKAKSVYRTLEELAGRAARPRLQARCFVRRQDLQKEEYWSDATADSASFEEQIIAGSRWLRARTADLVILYGESPWRVIGYSLGMILAFGLIYPLGGWVGTTTPSSSIIPLTPGRIAQDPILLWQSIYHSAMMFATGNSYGNIQAITLVGELLTTIEALLGPTLLALLVFVLGRRAAR